MSALIDVLEARNQKDRKVRATLRRSLAFAPGAFVPAYPYVEPFIKDAGLGWRREAYYLVAGLWAEHWRDGLRGQALPIGKACAVHQSLTGSGSTEARFINLLDADTDQLPHRLRQIVGLLKEQPIDFDGLLKGLLHWNADDKRTQNAWARDFYRSFDTETVAEPVPQEEGTP